MKALRFYLNLAVLSFLSLSMIWQCQKAPHNYTFSGGPAGGTFQYYAGGLADLNKKVEVEFKVQSSAGSIENIGLIHTAQADFAIANSGDVYMAGTGKLPGDTKKYDRVKTLAALYNASAQLIVRKTDSDDPLALSAKRVAIGNAGSGAAVNAEIYFRALGIWDKLQKEYIGYNSAATAFRNGQLDAFWIFAGFPNPSVLETALQTEIKLLDTWPAAETAGLLNAYPYFSMVNIPAGTYNGQMQDVQTFQSTVIWICREDIPEDVVYRLLDNTFSTSGLERLAEVHSSAREMSLEAGVKGIISPLHPGAEKFWKDKGVLR